MGPGALMIQRGTNYAWVNRSGLFNALYARR